MGFKLIFAGLVFFFNPCINIVDLFPDFIGCILISVGLRKLCDIEDRFATARKVANWMIPIYLLKFLLSFYIPVFWRDGLLPITFVYAVGETIMLFIFTISLYGAVEYMANLHDGDRHLTLTGNVCKLSLVFVAVKNVLAFIPEAFVLAKDPDLDLSHNARPTQTLTEAKPYVVLFFTVIVLAIGIYYIRENFRLFRGIAKDEKFNNNLFAIYKERILDNTKLMNRRRFNRFFVLMAVGALLMIDIIIDDINFTPDIFGYAVMCAALVCLIGKKAYIRLAPCLVPLTGISVMCMAYRWYCGAGVNYIMGYKTYFFDRIESVENGTAILVGGALSVFEGILMTALVFIILRSAGKVYTQLTEKILAPMMTVAVCAIHGVASVVSHVAPYVKAMTLNIYMKDTAVNAHYADTSAGWELAQGYANIGVLLTALILAYSFIKMKRKADIEL